MKIVLSFLLLVLLSCSPEEQNDETDASNLTWLPFDKSAFNEAEQENKLVLLDVGANWCHWCHVMDEKTYSDPEVIQFINAHFITTREDQDSRPDLYATFRSYGWPATIIFNAGGEELLKLRGYQSSDKFMQKLRAVIEHPKPVVEDIPDDAPVSTGSLNSAKILEKYVANLNRDIGGYKSAKMQLHKEGFELGLLLGAEKPLMKSWTEQTYANSIELVDPVWGGVSQYSDSWNWENPHYEKLLRVQAQYITAYCRYGVVRSDSNSIAKAEKIFGYCDRFLGKNPPLFANSQNADLENGKHALGYYEMDEEERSQAGFPSVDNHQYLRENAMMASALIDLWAATGKEVYLNRSVQMLRQFEIDFRNDDGSYNRSVEKNDILSMEDNRETMSANLRALEATGKARYLEEAIQIAKELLKIFRDQDGLMLPFQYSELVEPKPVAEDNLKFCIDLLKLGHYAINDSTAFFQASREIFRQLPQAEITGKMRLLPLVVELNRYEQTEPQHAVWLVSDNEPNYEPKLVRRLMLHRDSWLIIDRKSLDHLSGMDKELYQGVDSGTLFICTSNFCSAPIRNMTDLEEYLNR